MTRNQQFLMDYYRHQRAEYARKYKLARFGMERESARGWALFYGKLIRKHSNV